MIASGKKIDYSELFLQQEYASRVGTQALDRAFLVCATILSCYSDKLLARSSVFLVLVLQDLTCLRFKPSLCLRIPLPTSRKCFYTTCYTILAQNRA